MSRLVSSLSTLLAIAPVVMEAVWRNVRRRGSVTEEKVPGVMKSYLIPTRARRKLK